MQTNFRLAMAYVQAMIRPFRHICRGLATACAFLAVAALQEGCASEHRAVRAGHRDSVFIKPDPELARLKHRAVQGDGAAAYDVALHYEFGIRDRGLAQEWFRIADALGERRAAGWLRVSKSRIGLPLDTGSTVVDPR